MAAQAGSVELLSDGNDGSLSLGSDRCGRKRYAVVSSAVTAQLGLQSAKCGLTRISNSEYLVGSLSDVAEVVAVVATGNNVRTVLHLHLGLHRFGESVDALNLSIVGTHKLQQVTLRIVNLRRHGEHDGLKVTARRGGSGTQHAPSFSILSTVVDSQRTAVVGLGHYHQRLVSLCNHRCAGQLVAGSIAADTDKLVVTVLHPVAGSPVRRNGGGGIGEVEVELGGISHHTADGSGKRSQLSILGSHRHGTVRIDTGSSGDRQGNLQLDISTGSNLVVVTVQCSILRVGHRCRYWLSSHRLGEHEGAGAGVSEEEALSGTVGESEVDVLRLLSLVGLSEVSGGIDTEGRSIVVQLQTVDDVNHHVVTLQFEILGGSGQSLYI